jgi:hypothetical protein
MSTVLIVVAGLQTVLHLGTAGAKLSGHPKVAAEFPKMGIPADRVPVLAGLQIAGVVGTLAGFRWAGLGLAASLGFVLYMIGALALKWKAENKVEPPAVLGIALAITAAALFAQRL